MAAFDPIPVVARALNLRAQGVGAVIALLEDGNTVPFIARYRKEATGGMDEVAVQAIDEATKSALALEARRQAILSSIEEQGKLDPDLKRRIAAAADRQTLEDLYLPYKRTRKTRASEARVRGLAPLAARILQQPRDGDPAKEALAFLGDAVKDAQAALAGASDIAAEVMSEDARVRSMVRELTATHGSMVSKAIKAATKERTAFEDYYDYTERLDRLAPHRYLALCRGEQEGVLKVHVEIDTERMAARIEQAMGLAAASPWARLLRDAVADGYKRLLAPSIENEVRANVFALAEAAAVEVFAKNTRNLLLAPPFGQRPVVGIDPGFRTGCKCAAVDATGRFVGNTTVYVGAKDDPEGALLAFVRKHGAEGVAVGNGTAGREALELARTALAGLDVVVVSVSESGASVYSASEIARQEFPDLDLTVRGAISIARRLQDPLSELVKVDPASLGVGQYQHDVTPGVLKARLDRVVESCVNRVGVVLNTASAPLLERVAGIGPTLAGRIVEHRNDHGPFTSRRDLLKVKGLGPKAFEQSAGFLRVRASAGHRHNPLDDSAVHPERYELVRRIAADLGIGLEAIVGNASAAARIDIHRYVGADVGEPTLRDIQDELGRPGRDPRDDFEPPHFQDDVTKIEDLTAGMVLEGIVTNVTAFGAFVDIGVHQDGLVHVSVLADRFVKDPHAVVSVGQRIRVKVLSVDLARGRISLSAQSASFVGGS